MKRRMWITLVPIDGTAGSRMSHLLRLSVWRSLHLPQSQRSKGPRYSTLTHPLLPRSSLFYCLPALPFFLPFFYFVLPSLACFSSSVLLIFLTSYPFFIPSSHCPSLLFSCSPSLTFFHFFYHISSNPFLLDIPSRCFLLHLREL